MYDLSGVSFPDLRRWLGGHRATEDRAGSVSCEYRVWWVGTPTGTGWNRPERSGMGRVRERVG